MENPIDGNPFAEYDMSLAKVLREVEMYPEIVYRAIGYYYFARDYYHYVLEGNLQEELVYAGDVVTKLEKVLQHHQGFIFTHNRGHGNLLGLECVGDYTPEEHLYNLGILGATDMKILDMLDRRDDVKDKAKLCEEEVIEGLRYNPKMSLNYSLSRRNVEEFKCNYLYKPTGGGGVAVFK